MYKLFYNGHIHTLQEKKPYCTAILTLKDHIIYLGDGKEINLPEYNIEKIDLLGKHIFPGFIDCHTHIAAVALSKKRIRLDNCQSLNQALKQITKDIKKYKPDGWVLGGGWNANIWMDGKPHKKLLDDISREHAIVLYNKDGHTQWLNSLALNRCNITESSNNPEGGQFERDIQGELTGLVFEKACELVDQKAENVSLLELKNCMDELYHELYALGITSVHSCESFELYRLFRQMAMNKDLKLRVCMHPPVAESDKLINAGLFSGSGDKWLRLGGMKYFVDGSLGSQTAEMFEPLQTLNQSGVEVLKEKELSDRVGLSASYGLSATIHAIGDKANHKALNALETARKVMTPIPLRHRIEHCQILKESDLPRFKELDIIASMQPMHIADDIEIADKYLGKRARLAYPIGTLKKTGCRIVFGSDMPIADPDPLKGILAAVSRKYKLKKFKSTWYPEQCITAQQSLLAYTSEASFASYEETIKGSLAPGKLADFIVLSHDISKADEIVLRDALVEKTVLGGDIVFASDSLSA
jgi:predicted amidohydrolase YtcJ